MISPSIINYQNGKIKPVKNLGWILKNWKRVKYFQVITKNLKNPDNDAYLIAFLTDGSTYETGFADSTILFRFLKRPVFYSLKLFIDGVETKITKEG